MIPFDQEPIIGGFYYYGGGKSIPLYPHIIHYSYYDLLTKPHIINIVINQTTADSTWYMPSKTLLNHEYYRSEAEAFINNALKKIE